MSINIKFPLSDNKETNSFFKLNNTTKDALKSDLILLLTVRKGQRFYMPDYGTDLIKFIFEPDDILTAQSIEEDIKATVSRFIPQLTISAVLFNSQVDADGNELGENEISVDIKFKYANDALSQTNSLNLIF